MIKVALKMHREEQATERKKAMDHRKKCFAYPKSTLKANSMGNGGKLARYTTHKKAS